MNPPSAESIRQASVWMARLWADDVSQEDLRACQAWRQAASEHEVAWQQLQQLQSRFDELDTASHVLNGVRTSRRQLLVWSGLAVGTLAGLSQTPVWQNTLADYHSGVGECRTLTLDDGSQLTLNTRTRLDLRQNELHLLEGELLLARKSASPLLLHTPDGALLIGEARVALRYTNALSRVGIYAGVADLTPVAGSVIRLQEGQGAQFSRRMPVQMQPALEGDIAWLQGKLVAERMPVDRFVAELARYRHGILRADPVLAALHVTGVFSLGDIDQVLEQLASIHSLRILRRTRYWTRVVAG